jgi:predicted permease
MARWPAGADTYDVRYALRQLLRTPSFTGVAVLTLAVGIAVTTTMFALVDELALKPARGRSDQAVHVLIGSPGAGVLIPDYETLLATKPAGVDAMTAIDQFGSGLAQIPGRAERVRGLRVSGQYAAVHAVRAQAGRWINDDDNRGGETDAPMSINGVVRPTVAGTLGQDVVVISDRLWREWFDANPSVVTNGRLLYNRRPVRIVGVAPPGFEPTIDVWGPFGKRRLLTREELDRQLKAPFRPRGTPDRPAPPPIQQTLSVLVRVRAGANAKALGQELTALVSARPASDDLPRSTLRLVPRRGDTRFVSTGWTILGFAALVFIAACANLGNMLYGRAMEREGELATRLALGASQFSLFALLFAETLLICGAAAAAGMLLAAGALELFEQTVPAFAITSWEVLRLDLGLDWRVFICATAAGLTAALIVGAGSLWRSSRVSLLARLSASGPAVLARTEGRTLRTMLVAVQVTAAVLLLIATGMLLENTSKQLDRRLMFDTGGLVAARIELPEAYDESRGAHFYEQLVTRMRALPLVEAAAIMDALPAGEAPAPGRGLGVLSKAPEPGSTAAPVRMDGQWLYGSPGLPQTLDLPLRGRDFDAGDTAGSEPVAIVTESVARRLWPGQDALGQWVICCSQPQRRRVVGVLDDPVTSRNTAVAMDVATAMQRMTQESAAGAYVLVPAAQRHHANMLVVARTGSMGAAVDALRQAVAALDPDVPLFMAGPVHASQFSRMSAERAVRTMAGTLGLVSLAIAVLGVFAMVSYFVTRRTREFGLRLALGASRRQIMKLVIDHAIHMSLIGLLPGVLFASLGTRFFQAELTKLRPNGLTVWVFVPLLMVACAVVAAALPARRAARTDPHKQLTSNN